MQINTTTTIQLPMYFGDFGGILVPDSFTPDFLSFAEEAKAALCGVEFYPCFEAMLSGVPKMNCRNMTLFGIDTQIVQSQSLYYIVAGHLTLCKLRGTKHNYLGAENAEIARFAASVCRSGHIPCHITLSAALSGDETLKQELLDAGVQIDDFTCSKLYDRPQAYAFQKYLGNRAENGFVPVGANLGAYPYPALSGLFGHMWGEKLRGTVKMPEAVCATMCHGNAAVASFHAFPTCRLVTVESPICQQYFGEFCGCSMLMARTAAYCKYAVTLAPELTDMWRMAKVLRLGTEDYCESKEEQGICAATMRAAEIVRRRMPEVKSLLIVEGDDE